MPPHRGCGRYILTAGVLAASLIASLGIAPQAVAEDTPSGWESSSWTGVAAGAPVPGTGLPAAATPTMPIAVPPTYDVAAPYEGQAQCDPTPKPGAQRVSDLIKATYGQDQTVWIPRGCGVGGQSEHKEGRAVDWMTSVRLAQQRANAEAFLNWLLGPDQFGTPYGNAIRMGVMYIGWNDRIWRGYEPAKGWAELKGCFSRPAPGSDNDCHRNHIHISLTWDGATGTNSLWDATPNDAPYCPRVSSAAQPVGSEVRGPMVAVDPVRVLDTRAALGVAARCRLLQGTWSTTLSRMVVPVLGQGGIPATGVSGVRVRVSALGSNAPSTLRIWAPGQSSPTAVTPVAMSADAAGEISLPVSASGTIALATTAGATDIVVEVLGYYPVGSTGEVVPAQATPATPTQSIGAAPPASAPVPVPAPTSEPAPQAPVEAEAPPTATATAGFVPLGSIVGYESAATGPLQPGEQRTIGLAGLPVEATSAVLFVTAKDSTGRGFVRVGGPGKSGARLRFPKKGMEKAVLVVPVSGGSLPLANSKKASVQMRIEVLGYATNDDSRSFVSLPEQSLFTGSLAAGQVTTVKGAGRLGLPKKKRIKAVLLRVQTRKSTSDGTVFAYASNGLAPTTRSAPILANKKYASLVLAPIGPDGKVAMVSTVDTKVRASVVGYVR